VLVLAVVVSRVRTVPLAIGAGLVLGGAVGNVAERIFGGHAGRVPDFVTLEHWPTFNPADACVTAGVIVVIVCLLFAHPDGEAAAGPARPQQGTATR
jgi:signal peptidase II